MSYIETYYLVDFENVHEDGLSGANQLGSVDHVHLFSTKNAPKISIETLTNLNCTDLSSHEIPVGSQSLDMHLVSYLGFLLGKNQSNNCKYIIISKDTDYDNIIAFWKKNQNANIERQTAISVKNPKSSSPKKQTNAAKPNSPASHMRKSQISATSTQINTEIQKAISKAGYPNSTINKVASIVVKHYGEEKCANNIHNELKATYTDYTDIYKIVKPIITKYIQPVKTVFPKNNAEAIQIRSEIQKSLSNVNFGNDVANSVASLVAKHYNEKDGKQAIYRSIILKYGQKQGLNIYNHIKKKCNCSEGAMSKNIIVKKYSKFR